MTPMKIAGPALRWGFKLLVVSCILFVGIFLRTEDFTAWVDHPERTMFEGAPILATFDGYYFLRFAREIAEGGYSKTDELRTAPSPPARPFPAPLLSLTTVAISKVSGVRIEWIATLFSSFVAVLLFFPLYFIGRRWGDSMAGMIAGLVGLCSPYYVNRTALGWYDTDCGNVIFTMLAIYLPVLMASRQGKARLAHLAAIVVNCVVFLLWWEASLVVMAITVAPVVYAYLFLIGPKKRDVLPLGVATFLGLIAVTVWKGWAFWADLPHYVGHMWIYITKSQNDIFANVSQTVSEQGRMPLMGIVSVSADNWVLFECAIAGLVLLVIKARREAVPLLIPLGLGLLTFYAKRFGIFLAPVVGLGTGQLFYVLREKAKSKRYRTYWTAPLVLAFCMLGVTIYQMTITELARTYWPVESPEFAEGISWVQSETPKNSVIWAWWDHGYPVEYWGRRATIADGSFHDGEITLITAFPFCSIDYRQSANWMQFYTTRGLDGFHKVYDKAGGIVPGMELIRNVMHWGPEDSRKVLAEKGFEPVDRWLAFFFPPKEERKPLYMVVDQLLVGTSYWWYWLGSWDPETREGEHPFFELFGNVRREGNRVTGLPPFVADLDSGELKAGNMNFPLSRFVFSDEKEWHVADYKKEGLVFEYDPKTAWAALCSPDIHDSTFNRLFFLRMADVRYFTPVLLKSPTFLVWKVMGDEAPAPAN